MLLKIPKRYELLFFVFMKLTLLFMGAGFLKAMNNHNPTIIVSRNSNTALIQEIKSAASKIVRDALDCDALLEIRDENNNNILHIIADAARISAVHQQNNQEDNQDSYSTLLAFLREKNGELFNHLLTETNDHKEIPLHRSVYNNGERVYCLQVIYVLLGENRIGIWYPDATKTTPLHYVIRSSSLDLLKIMIPDNTSVPVVASIADARSYLEEAINSNNNKMLEYMLSRGLFINALGFDDNNSYFLNSLGVSSADDKETLPVAKERLRSITLLLLYGAYVPAAPAVYTYLATIMCDYLTPLERAVIIQDSSYQEEYSATNPEDRIRAFELAVGQGNSQAVEYMVSNYLNDIPHDLLEIVYERLQKFMHFAENMLGDSKKLSSYNRILRHLALYIIKARKFLEEVRAGYSWWPVRNYVMDSNDGLISFWVPAFSLEVMQQARETTKKNLKNSKLSKAELINFTWINSILS